MRHRPRRVACIGQEISVDDVSAEELSAYLQSVKDFLRLAYWTW